ncbi:MAG: hypothetical protein J6L88_04735 [Clostridia bacterium]|nr:hypothetical protein [Clostridia bacterium]
MVVKFLSFLPCYRTAIYVFGGNQKAPQRIGCGALIVGVVVYATLAIFLAVKPK